MVRSSRRSARDPLKLRCSVLSFAYFGVVCFAMPHKLQRDNLFKLFAGMISYVSFLALLVLKYVGDPELAPPGACGPPGPTGPTRAVLAFTASLTHWAM